MATYKVLQDVEAEDKILGPFTIRQFIYIIIIFLCLWLSLVFTRSTITLIFLPLSMFPALFLSFLVFLGVKNPSQPAENYLAALVRFYFKQRRRIWDQEGILDNVIITAPKISHLNYSDGLSRTQVRGKLSQLAGVMDSRGWAAKNTVFQGTVISPQTSDDDRLISIGQIPQVFEPTDIHAQDDIMDEAASPVAQAFGQMIQEKQTVHKQQAIANMQNPNYDPYPSMQQRVLHPIGDEPAMQPSAQASYSYDDQPLSTPVTYQQPNPPQVTPTSPAILELAQEGGDNLSIQTIANEAERIQQLESGDEISLH